MSIPNHRRVADDDAPPPLPPPRFLPGMGPTGPPGHDHFPPSDSYASWNSSGRDSGCEPGLFRKLDSDRRYGRPSHKDEGYHSLTSIFSSKSSQDTPPHFMSHTQYQFNKQAGSDYDSHLLKKLDHRRAFDNRSPPRRSGLSASMMDEQEKPRQQEQARLDSRSLPIRPSANRSLESPGPSGVPLIQTALRGGTYYQPGGPSHRSPVEPLEMDRSPVYRSRRNNSDDGTMSLSSYDNNTDDTDFPMDETSGIRRLHIDDAHGWPMDSRAAGQKRRASSPPVGDSPPQAAPGSSDLTRRRDGALRGSPAPRLSLVPPSALSAGLSALSAGARSGSYVSTMSSHNSFGGRSPSGLSSGGMSPVEVMGNAHYSMAASQAHSPFGQAPHQRNPSGETRLASPRRVLGVPRDFSSMSKGGYYMCTCCPKKPKKFETEEELSNHTAEKQYECAFCGNRFKNKNEAERHQNSLHVRRHSWSCSALLISSFYRAFHESTSRPGDADICGYCGEEFPRSGGPAGSRQVTNADWDERLRHLQEVHKFRECNSSKKFYRADHFRQHLKHSHAGTSGKWTNMLENACMIEEDPPQPPR
ncbi:hypothetical protein F5Y17DRAFT_466827 [Xylariaceae sp. FL0594]|nr:hypothetical protein F5Y17DRAFT_466827 [Xylariaceae sp. FL0594]